ncbi:hypothetical protein CUR86_20425 [Salinicola acroporae]|uniref:DUF2243 domain-containing protein n=2 Tax=Salinicola acroporae TaxID=1541440 RepID=A0ABT6HZQ4_9GAMM|nr:hypothetical protein [Salinicola acroporae]MDH4574552.1 hypothetical protein [Salinicola acroporae]
MSERVQRRTGATMVTAVLLGVGIMAALDEIVFHQVLAWHHFVEAEILLVCSFSRQGRPVGRPRLGIEKIPQGTRQGRTGQALS